MKETHTLYAVADGKLLPLSAVPDEAFASGLLGDGYAIEPTSDIICSPVCGTVANVASAGHAFVIAAEDGMDILVHIGVDTVELDGNPFSDAVAVGSRVAVGDKLTRVDLAAIRAAGYSTITPVLITNVDAATVRSHAQGTATCGITPAVTYTY